MACDDSSIGGRATGMTNGSDFSRWARNKSGAAACRNTLWYSVLEPLRPAHGDHGCWEGFEQFEGGGLFPLPGFGLSNVVGNDVPGEIDLTGIFPLYIDIRRGSIIAVTFVRVYQPWQLVDCAPSFLYVISSFSILLAPIVGMMVADFYFVQKMRLKLSEPHGDFWYSGWVNWRAFPAWIVGWAPTIGGLILVSTPELRRDLPFPQTRQYSCPGFFSSLLVFYLTNLVFPVCHVGDMGYLDVYGTFTHEEAKKLGIISVLPIKGGSKPGGEDVYGKVPGRQDNSG